MLRRNAPGKINLGLHVLRKRDDGYHDVETVFVRIPWSDVLCAQAADEIVLTCTDPSIPVGDDNLVVQAARRLHPRKGAVVDLEKHLPVGAGLGGGSSDAAAALLLLNDLWALQRSRAELAALAAEIGSDVAFFVDGEPSALGTGRGERLETLVDPVTDEPYRMPFPLVVAVPHVRVSTAAAYGLIEPRENGRPRLKELVLSNDPARWRAELTNDFEASVLRRFPPVADTKAALERAGAAYASLSGSGAAVFGIFEDDAHAAAAAEALRRSGHRTWHGRV